MQMLFRSHIGHDDGINNSFADFVFARPPPPPAARPPTAARHPATPPPIPTDATPVTLSPRTQVALSLLLSPLFFCLAPNSVPRQPASTFPCRHERLLALSTVPSTRPPPLSCAAHLNLRKSIHPFTPGHGCPDGRRLTRASLHTGCSCLVRQPVRPTSVHVCSLPQSPSSPASPRSCARPPTVRALPGAMADHASSPRDSHDLTPRDVTRDSLVVNMLQSLDQFSLAHPPGPSSAGPSMTAAAYDDYSTRLWANDAARSRRRSAAHKSSHGSSESQLFDPVSTPIPHSNTTPSDFHTQLLRLGVVHDVSHRSRPGTGPRTRPTGHRHGSSGSGGASIDAALYPAPDRHGRAARRSASFDHALRRPDQSSTPRPDLTDDDDDDDDQDDNDDNRHDEYSAAPMPTIPSGPRRETSSALRYLPPPPEPVGSRSSDCKRSSSRSTKSSPARSKRAAAPRTTPTMPTTPVMAQPDADSAPAPSVGYRTPKEKEAETSSTALAQPRERPGFFRRVFGGTSSRTNLAAAANAGSHGSQPSSPSPTSPDWGRSASNSRTHQQTLASQSKAYPTLSSRDLSSNSLTQQPPLQKKTSSFFRRRKKSPVDETIAPPDLGSHLPAPSLDNVIVSTAATARDASASAQKSPTSSLRVVMNPYLNGGAAGLGLSNMHASPPLSDITNTTGDRPAHATGRLRYKRGFSAQYEPSASARIRTVHSEDGGARAQEIDGAPVSAGAQPSKETSDTGDGSFLDLDAGSDNEPGTPERRGEKGPVKGKRKLKHQMKLKDTDSGLGEAARAETDPDATIRGNRKNALQISDPFDGQPDRHCRALRPSRATSPRSLGSTETGYKTAPSAPPSLLVEGTPDESGSRNLGTHEPIQAGEPLDEPGFVVGEPTEDDRKKAQAIYDGGQAFIQKEKAASWMGEEGPVRQRTLQAYMELYNFKDKSILSALRGVCGRLVFRAETQQVDRILVAFSKRWCLCNPHHGFKAIGMFPCALGRRAEATNASQMLSTPSATPSCY